MSRCACYPPASSACPRRVASVHARQQQSCVQVHSIVRPGSPACPYGMSHQPSRTIRAHTHTIAYNEPVDTGVPCRVRNSQQPSPIRVIVTPRLLRSISGLTPRPDLRAEESAPRVPRPRGAGARRGAPAPPSSLPLVLARGPIELARACRRPDRGPTCGEVATISSTAPFLPGTRSSRASVPGGRAARIRTATASATAAPASSRITCAYATTRSANTVHPSGCEP